MPRLAAGLATAATLLAGAACAQSPDPVEQPPPNVPDFNPAFPEQTRAPALRSGFELAVETVAQPFEHPWGVALLPDGGYPRHRAPRPPPRRRPRRQRSPPPSPASPRSSPEARAASSTSPSRRPSPRTAPSTGPTPSPWPAAPPPPPPPAAASPRTHPPSPTCRTSSSRTRPRAPPTTTARASSRTAPATSSSPPASTSPSASASSPRTSRPPTARSSASTSTAPRPPTTPSPASPDAVPTIWSLGHRNIQAAALDADGQLWTVEHGPQGGDELNRIEPGKNYGWPVISYGQNYDGSPVGEGITAREGLEQPRYYWDPVIAPSGMAFYDGAMFPEWQGDLLVGSLTPGALVRLQPRRRQGRGRGAPPHRRRAHPRRGGRPRRRRPRPDRRRRRRAPAPDQGCHDRLSLL